MPIPVAKFLQTIRDRLMLTALSRPPHALGHNRGVRGLLLCAVSLLSLMLGVVVTWPLALHLPSALPYDLGDPLLNTYILAWDADRLRHGVSGLWDATLFFPYRQTLAWSEHLLGAAVFTAPLQWLTGNPVLVHNVAVLASYGLAGAGMFGLVRHLTGRTDAALVAAVAFVCAPHRAMLGSRVQMLLSGWMPLALWALHAYFATGQRRALAGFVAAFAALGLTNGYFLYFFAVTIVVVAGGELVLLVRHAPVGRATRAPGVWPVVRDLSVAAAALLAVILPVALVYLDVQQTMGFSRSRNEILMFSATLDDYRRALPHMVIWPGVLAGGDAERTLFPGAVVLLLALIGGVVPGRVIPDRASSAGTPHRRVTYLVLAVVAIWMSMGLQHDSYAWMLDVVPGLSGLRVPARMVVVVSLALSVLGGFGAAWLLCRVGPLALRVVLCGLLMAGLLRDGYGGPIPIHVVDPLSRERTELTRWMATQAPGAVLEWPLFTSRNGWTRNLPAQMASLDHTRRVVNGYSGYGSALQDFVGGPGSPALRSGEWPALFDGLSRLGVRIVVVSRDAPLMPDLRPDAPQIAEVWQGDTLTAYALHDPAPNGQTTPAGPVLLPGIDFTVTVSHRPDRVNDMLDGNPMTRWISGDAQRGDEWVAIALARPVTVGALLMDVPVETANYPRHLVIEVVTSEGPTVTAFSGSVVPHILEAMAASPRRPVMRFALPPQPIREIRLRQTTSVRTWNWHIAELQLLGADERHQ